MTRVKNIVFTVSLFLVLFLVTSMTSDKIVNSYAQTLTKEYANQKCNISINYPSDWKFEETEDDPSGVLNFIVELQPNKEEGFNNVVGIELNDISSLSDRSFEAIRDFEEQTLSDLSEIVKVETSESTQIADYPAQKIVYNELIAGDKKMEIFTVAFDREYKITYDATSSYYDKYLPTLEEMIKTFKIDQPSFEGIVC